MCNLLLGIVQFLNLWIPLLSYHWLECAVECKSPHQLMLFHSRKLCWFLCQYFLIQANSGCLQIWYLFDSVMYLVLYWVSHVLRGLMDNELSYPLMLLYLYLLHFLEWILYQSTLPQGSYVISQDWLIRVVHSTRDHLLLHRDWINHKHFGA